MDEPAVITGLGMISPVGLNMAQTCASVRAGISRFQEYEDYTCEPEELDWGDPEPLVGSRVPDPDLERNVPRIPTLILEALQDLIQNAGIKRETFSQASIYIALPSPDRTGQRRGGRREPFTDILEKALPSTSGELKFFTNGPVGFFAAMEEAILRLRKGQSQFCIVGGADSYQDQNTLAWLDRSGRLKSNRNWDGFIPGEAAAVLLLESRARAEERGANIFAMTRGLGKGLEKNPVGTDRPSSGEGLAQAIRAAIGGAENPLEIEWVAGDLNGESYRAKEWGLGQVMLQKNFRGAKHIWHPADSLGDVGAASGAVLVSLAARALEKGYAPAEKCLIFAGSDDGSRGALLLQRNQMQQTNP